MSAGLHRVARDNPALNRSVNNSQAGPACSAGNESRSPPGTSLNLNSSSFSDSALRTPRTSSSIGPYANSRRGRVNRWCAAQRGGEPCSGDFAGTRSANRDRQASCCMILVAARRPPQNWGMAALL